MMKRLLPIVLALSGLWVFYQSTIITSGGTLPSTCVTGGVFVKTGSGAGFYFCDATPAWVGPASTGGGGITELTGDVTAGPGSGSQAATIPNNTVTYAKMQDISAASRILCRGSAGGSGDTQECTAGSGISISGTTISASGVAGGGPTFSVKTSDESVTSSAALQNDDELAFAIGASETWEIEFNLSYDGAILGDIKLAVNVPASATGMTFGNNLSTTAGSNSGDMTTFSSTDLTDTGVHSNGAGGTTFRSYAKLIVYIVNSTNAGNVQLRWAQNVSNGTATTVYAGSYIKAFRVN